jgi:hypothetical protein
MRISLICEFPACKIRTMVEVGEDTQVARRRRRRRRRRKRASGC